jgi:hypothetical protein
MSYLFVPKEFDKLKLEPPAKPTKVVYEKQGVPVLTLTITYEGATENIERVEVTNVA